MSKLKSIVGTCEGQKWADEQESYKKAWEICDRGDLMLRVACKAGVDLRVLTKVKVEYAKLVEHLMTDERSINALRVGEKFADGEASLEELKIATGYAYAAYADADAAAAYARAETLKQCADICRKYIDFNDIEKYLNKLD